MAVAVVAGGAVTLTAAPASASGCVDPWWWPVPLCGTVENDTGGQVGAHSILVCTAWGADAEDHAYTDRNDCEETAEVPVGKTVGDGGVDVDAMYVPPLAVYEGYIQCDFNVSFKSRWEHEKSGWYKFPSDCDLVIDEMPYITT
ncbi:hypothetical protein [Streptomyces longispororuber]|uniref:hypothetical protein n=1 Tax=Streptomyces longispororuber TaxID=68230 RepID=UPI00210AF095|nr:hypothetical protein [Streptomyces longispororuber]MCQ4208747.1 hypothetical protein [Streptomyces longispororuber]